MLNSVKKTYNGFPSLFWVVVFTSFIDSIGSTLLFPFFALYITEKFGVGMTQAGILIGMSSLAGIIGSTIGGALTDRFGRRRLILFGLIFSAVSSLSFGLANNINLLYFLVILVGLLSRVAAPAQDAMMADILPENKRQEGFGITRVVFNFSWIIGTALGGLLAEKSFFALFVTDAVLSSLVALILYFKLPETQPAHHKEAKKNESLKKTFADYRIVLRDAGYISFTVAGILSLLVYQQQYSSLPVYLRDTHGIAPKIYGAMLSITGLEVVLLQFWVSRKIRKFTPFLTMTAGVLFFMAGFTMIGLIRSVPLFLAAVIIITIGEMIVFPTNRVIATGFAPEDMRGRYMAIYDLGWTLPATIGPAAAGLILDHYNPHLLWYLGGALCALSAFWYYLLHLKLGAEPRFQPSNDE
ncbi:MAG: MFS transporter [Anaerolineae bacterium]|nr:MFS transporter [Anaerolineae bacterium]MBL8104132.1 MFS transporter [Anaerolineales bacterium]MCC7190988.1 MFS transporter [Anaerolineales bacterium]